MIRSLYHANERICIVVVVITKPSIQAIHDEEWLAIRVYALSKCRV